MNEEEVKIKHSEMDMIQKAEMAAERLEKANEAMYELVKRQELIESRRLFGGRAEAGDKTPEVSQEEKDKIDMKNYFKGTILGDMLK